MDIGESLVGAYMRQVRECYSVTYNTHLPTAQGEIDVIGVRLGEAASPPLVYVAEVAVHLDGLNYGSSALTVSKIRTKMAMARAYAEAVYPGATLRLEFWSPRVPPGLVSQLQACGGDLVVNQDFTDAVQEMLLRASRTTKIFGDDAFRMLQMLTHLKGAKDLRLA